jgi:hypothetical protein
LTVNRNRNQLSNASWIRLQICNQTKTNSNLMNGPNAQSVNQILCNLTDSELVSLFTLLSEQIDFNGIKNTVFYFLTFFLKLFKYSFYYNSFFSKKKRFIITLF